MSERISTVHFPPLEDPAPPSSKPKRFTKVNPKPNGIQHNESAHDVKHNIQKRPETPPNVRSAIHPGVPEAVQQLKNPHEAFADVWRDIRTLKSEIEAFHSTDNRHGSLQVIRSAARRIIGNVDALVPLRGGMPLMLQSANAVKPQPANDRPEEHQHKSIGPSEALRKPPTKALPPCFICGSHECCNHREIGLWAYYGTNR